MNPNLIDPNLKSGEQSNEIVKIDGKPYYIQRTVINQTKSESSMGGIIGMFTSVSGLIEGIVTLAGFYIVFKIWAWLFFGA